MRELGYLQNEDSSIWNVVRKFGLAEKFRHGTWAVASVDNLVRPTTVAIQFVTPSVHHCVQHSGPDAARRTGPSATSETVVYLRSGVDVGMSVCEQCLTPHSQRWETETFLRDRAMCQDADVKTRDTSHDIKD